MIEPTLSSSISVRRIWPKSRNYLIEITFVSQKILINAEDERVSAETAGDNTIGIFKLNSNFKTFRYCRSKKRVSDERRTARKKSID